MQALYIIYTMYILIYIHIYIITYMFYERNQMYIKYTIYEHII